MASRHLMAVALLCGLALLNTACPIIGPYLYGYEYYLFGYEYNAKEFCLYMIAKEGLRAPEMIRIENGPMYTPPAQSNTRVGTFGINNDYVGAPEFKFAIQKDGSTLCVDFNSDGNCNDGNTITYDSGTNVFSIDTGFDATLGIRAGLYYWRFQPQLFAREQQSEPYVPIGITLSGDGDETQFWKALTANANYIPWYANGRAGDLAINTTLIGDNPLDWMVQGCFTVRDLNGDPLDITIDGTTSSQHCFDIPAMSSVTIEPELKANLTLGSITWESDWKIGISASYATFRNDVKIGTAGLASAGIGTNHLASAFEGGPDRGTSYAVGNLTHNQATVNVMCKDDQGNEFAGPDLSIPPWGTTAGFASELCGTTPQARIRSVYFKSRCDLGVITLESDGDSITQGSLNATRAELEILRLAGPWF